MNPASPNPLDAFGEAVVREVYDRSCEFLLAVMAHGMNGNRPDELHLAYRSLDPETATVVRRFVLEAVDQTFAQFLAFLDNRGQPLLFPMPNGDRVDLKSLSDGLAAEPYTESGWIARFSKFKEGIPEPKSGL